MMVTIVKHEWQIEVEDAYKLARMHPNCVTIKPELTEIKDMLDQGLKVNGIKATKVTKSTVRAVKEKEAIGV